MSFWVYILYSEKDTELYVGQTNNLKNRLHCHNTRQVKSTKNRTPLVCIHNEEHATRSEAMEREKFLKSLWGAREKKKIKQEYLDSLG